MISYLTFGYEPSKIEVNRGDVVKIPMFLEYVDPKKFMGFVFCVKVCASKFYKMQEKEVEKIKKAVLWRQKKCLSDCPCHFICPLEEGQLSANFYLWSN